MKRYKKKPKNIYKICPNRHVSYICLDRNDKSTYRINSGGTFRIVKSNVDADALHGGGGYICRHEGREFYYNSMTFDRLLNHGWIIKV